MLLTEDRYREHEWRHARDERLRIHQHLQIVREARGDARRSTTLRRRLGASIVRLGRRVAGEPVGSPVLTA